MVSFFLVTFFRVSQILPVAYVRVANLVRPGCSVHCYAPVFSQDLLVDYRWHIQATYWRTGTPNWYRTHYRFEIMPPNSDIGACHYINALEARLKMNSLVNHRQKIQFIWYKSSKGVGNTTHYGGLPCTILQSWLIGNFFPIGSIKASL